MHVLLLGPYPPPEGGINRNILAIREELLAAGHECSIIATSRSTKIVPEPNVYHPLNPLHFLNLLRSIKADIIHLHVGGSITHRVLALALVATIFGAGKRILSFHSGGYPSTKEGASARPNSFRGALFRRFERIIAVNPLIAEVFERYGISTAKIDVIYPFVHRRPDPGVELRPEHDEFVRQHSPFLLTVGLLEDEYDLFMQIDALEEIIAVRPDAGLMIVGSGSLHSRLREAIDAKPYGNSILLAGDVEHRETLHLINRADALLRTTRFDGDAISVREALFLDTPVIATDNGMRPDGVTLVPVGDANALVAAVTQIAAQTKSRNAPDRDDKSNIQAILEVYDEVLS